MSVSPKPHSQPKGGNELGTPVQISQAEWRHRAPMDGLGCGIEQAKHVDDTLDVHVSSTETVIEPKLMCACAMPVYQGRLIMVAGARLQERPSLRNSPHHLCDVHHGNRCWVTGAPHDQVLDGILRIQGQLYHIVRAGRIQGRAAWRLAYCTGECSGLGMSKSQRPFCMSKQWGGWPTECQRVKESKSVCGHSGGCLRNVKESKSQRPFCMWA
mmetsp:Transcript_41952/g.97820  ORF Transcript_41952/g.97820 Transcript_41952/m.97820 type:complete len:213 (-) Transcript_41952:68-706(-)